jgi:hypothetical protein
MPSCNNKSSAFYPRSSCVLYDSQNKLYLPFGVCSGDCVFYDAETEFQCYLHEFQTLKSYCMFLKFNAMVGLREYASSVEIRFSRI